MENSIKIDPFGFREYDARWLYPDDINLEGVTNLGKGDTSYQSYKQKKSKNHCRS